MFIFFALAKIVLPCSHAALSSGVITSLVLNFTANNVFICRAQENFPDRRESLLPALPPSPVPERPEVPPTACPRPRPRSLPAGIPPSDGAPILSDLRPSLLRGTLEYSIVYLRSIDRSSLGRRLAGGGVHTCLILIQCNTRNIRLLQIYGNLVLRRCSRSQTTRSYVPRLKPVRMEKVTIVGR